MGRLLIGLHGRVVKPIVLFACAIIRGIERGVGGAWGGEAGGVVWHMLIHCSCLRREKRC